MTRSAGDIAEQMRDARVDRVKSQQLLGSLFAETIELRHVPPHPNDGPISGRFMRDVSRREVEAAGRALPDLETESEVVAEGDTIRVRGRNTGTLADGTRVEVRTDTSFTVADGFIVALQSDMDEQSMRAWGQVLAAGGFQIPEMEVS